MALKKKPAKKKKPPKAAVKIARRTANRKLLPVKPTKKRNVQRAAPQDRNRFTKETLPSRKLPGEKTDAAGAPRYFFNSDIPQAYNQDYMCALPRDPEWIFVYWEFSSETLRKTSKNPGPKKRILRMFDVTDIHFNGANAWSQYDIEINEFSNNWYLKVPQPGRNYLIACGELTPDNTFTEILRSNVVKVPRADISDQTDEEWTTIHTDELLKLSADALRRGSLSSERIMGILPSQVSALHFDLSSHSRPTPPEGGPVTTR